MSALVTVPATVPVETVPVLAAPALDPGMLRISLELPAGLTIAEILTSAMPDLSPDDLARARVVLVSPRGVVVIDRAYWHRVRPRPGVHVVIRVIPGNIKSILQAVVSIAAIALGQFWAPAMAGVLGIGASGWAGIIGLGVTVLGNLLINALIPPPEPKGRDRSETFQISGWRNRLDPNGVLPEVLGKVRYAPPFAAPPYTEIVGDLQYIRAIFTAGVGPLTISDIRIGDTSIDEYDEVEIEVREGLASDAPISIYPQQVLEESIGSEVARPLPRDDQGEVIEDEPGEQKPVIRTTGADATAASVIFGFPAGLYNIHQSTGEMDEFTVELRIRQRPAGTTAWTLVETLAITAGRAEGFYRQHTWEFPTRGRYDIEVTRLTDETVSTDKQSRSTWVALQTIRPEYPLNFAKPLSLIAVRVKATYQLNGQLDNLNALFSRRCKDWSNSAGAWVDRATSNPAALFRHALQSKSNPKPVTDAGIDLTQLVDWHDFCRTKGLKYDRVLQDETTLREILSEVASAGRAAQRHDGLKWGVIIDRPRDLVVDHINPRNAWQIQASRTYFEPPHAFRVQFLDATNDYQPAERLVPWPGHSGPITLTEQLELRGKTDPAEIWVEARRRMYEALHRPDVYSCVQAGQVRTATRGDLVVLNTDMLERTQAATRVKSTTGMLVELDSKVEMVAGKSYAMRFRKYANNEDSIGVSVVRPLRTIVGERASVVIDADGGDLPKVDAVVHIGPAASESFPLVITRIEMGTGQTSVLRLADAAPIIDQLTDAEVAPAWSSRVGEEIDPEFTIPPVPVFVAIKSGVAGTGTAGHIVATVAPGSGSVVTSRYQLRHRLAGASTWTTVTFPAADGGKKLTGYVTGNSVELQAIALSTIGTPSAPTVTVTITVGGKDAPIPGALDSSDIEIGALLGGAVVQFVTSDDPATRLVQLYHSVSATLNRATDAVGEPVAVRASRSYSLPLGDVTRETGIANGDFADASHWSLTGAGFSIGSGKATHAAGSTGAITQACTLSAGATYRVSYSLTLTAGSLRARFTGGTDRDGTLRSASGTWSDRISAVAGNNTLVLSANAAFAGSVDDVSVYRETATCLPLGTNYVWLEPQNADGTPGPISGPFSLTIR